MSSTNNKTTLSNTLKQITQVKIEELDFKQRVYNTRKIAALDVASSHNDGSHARARATQLAKNIAGVNIPFIDNDKLKNVFSYLEQASIDPSVPAAEISRHERWLLRNLNHQSNRLEHATLFSAVLSEHLDRSTDTSASEREDSLEDDDSLDGSFEILTKDRLQQLREKFEDVVFNEYRTDEQAIHDYLNSLFPTEELKNKMDRLRDRLGTDTNAIFEQEAPFDEDVLGWVIGGLLHNDLLRDDQKALLKNFRQDDLVCAELCDVLNMRWDDLYTWEWTDDDSGLDVEPRKQLNGKFRVVMQEDILQSMLVHYIGVKLCVDTKENLKYWLKEAMQSKNPLTDEEHDRRSFYVGQESYKSTHNLMTKLDTAYWNDVFLSQLPDSVGDTGGYEDDQDKKTSDEKKSWVEIRQQLLHHVASKVLIDRKIYGDVAVVQTDLQWFGTSIPHSTIYAVLKFCGLSDEWLTWFRTYLEVPLNMTKVAGERQEVRKRKRGVPIAHALGRYLGEIILVFLDIAVKQETGLLLYRMSDDIMLCGPTKQCEKGWETMQNFTEIMGLEFNMKKTGSVSLNATTSQKARLPDGNVAVDFLTLSPDRGLWVIDNEMVNNHIRQLKKQLDETKDVLSFIRTYNSCIGRFFGHTFGLPAHCLGPKHVQDILETHHRIQKELFGEAGVSAVLKEKLNALAREKDLPNEFKVSDSFIYNPILLGGLGVTNPFIPLLLVQSDLRQNTPEQRVNDFHELEHTLYKAQKERFERETLSSRKRRYAKILEDNNLPKKGHGSIDIEKYWSFEEWLKYPEWTSTQLLSTYEKLMKSPERSPILLSSRVKEDLKKLTEGGAKHVGVGDLSAEERYKVQMFSEEMYNTFGTVAIVDRTLAPLGVMKAVMGEKVTWQMVL